MLIINLKRSSLSLITTLLLSLTTSLALADLNSGLFAYYPFNGNAQDESGNGHDGIVQGAILTEDRLGNADSAYRFNGVNDYIRVPDFSLDYDNDFTFSLWVTPTNPIDKGILFNRESVYEMRIFDECSLRGCDNDEVIHENEFGVAVYEDWDWYSMNYTAVANEPQCVTMVYDKDNAQVLSYVNGILTSTDQIGHDRAGASNNFLCMGARGNCDSDFFAGVLDDIYVYSRALSQSEIQQLCDTKELSVDLSTFMVTAEPDGIRLVWTVGIEENHAGYRLWRAIADGNGNYVNIKKLLEFGNSEQVNPEPHENCLAKIQGQLKANNSNQFPKLISTIGNSSENSCYSFTDTSDLSDETYYYLLEDVSDNGDSTFHCDRIDAVTVGQGPAIDLESAINYCKEVTGSNN